VTVMNVPSLIVTLGAGRHRARHCGAGSRTAVGIPFGRWPAASRIRAWHTFRIPLILIWLALATCLAM